MHSAKVASSPRLQRVHDLLQDGRIYSTRQIVVFADVCAVNSCIAELRANGAEIRCLRTEPRRRRKCPNNVTPSDPSGACGACEVCCTNSDIAHSEPIWTYQMTKPVPGYVSKAKPARMPF